ncbi:NAD(P)-dependent oxidoreductase [Streptomyces chromofuscus]|uniref:NAD(P)-dependent oxidoreductase n=1 Tax=Streptomyces chromofuscus TaxID=42881 RepID=A0A7M2T7H0_STRCW|nr:NAD(P)-dependent oxidoreductase [Streptomyces chromofuscus]QOV44670.1 NAD(P)-dependent oxidoreductase [Streptomyces chromofuscus]GGT01265.1 6-phosphogluconate dehydrogenase [Streptomyces chromofuscus]
MRSIRRVGFIGLGDQGGPMAEAIGESGFDLHVWARRPASLSAVAAVPHVVHGTVADLAASVELIALCLRDDTDMWHVLDDQHLLANIAPGTIVVNHGTGDPGEAERIGAHVAAAGAVYLDAPVSGGGPGARARTLTTFVGGLADTFEAARPVFAAFSDTVRLMGPVGGGQLTKLFNNALTITNMKNAEDVLALADQVGLDLPPLIEIIGASSGGSAALRALGTDITPGLAEHLDPLMRKDMQHFAQAVRERGARPEEVLERGMAGASGLLQAARLVARTRT